MSALPDLHYSYFVDQDHVAINTLTIGPEPREVFALFSTRIVVSLCVLLDQRSSAKKAAES
jgi:hypothetical protein